MPDEKLSAPRKAIRKKKRLCGRTDLGLRHSTTDVLWPIAGSDSCWYRQGGIFDPKFGSLRNGLRPHEQPDAAFWYLLEQQSRAKYPLCLLDQPKKTERIRPMSRESGAVHAFIAWYDETGVKFFPCRTAKTIRLPILSL